MQLPLWAYLLVSAAAIAVLAWMVHRLRPGAAPALTAGGALQTFAGQFPAAGAAAAIASADGRSFVILGPSERILGCVALIGLRWTARRIMPAEVTAAQTHGARVTVSLADFTWPSLTLFWRDAAEARIWAERFDALGRNTVA